MADSTIPNLIAVTTPAGTDEFGVRQSGDTRDKKQTRAQLNTLQSGEHLVLPQVNEPLTPTMAIGAADSGLFAPAADQLSISLAGIQSWDLIGVDFSGNANDAARIKNQAATIAGPTILPSRNDGNTGLGWATDRLSLVAGGLDCLSVAEVGSVRQIGFYVTTPVSLQTGVAVTAAGVHAALVNLGLITA